MATLTFSTKEQIFLPAGIYCFLSLMARVQSGEHYWLRAVPASKRAPILSSNTTETAWNREYYSAQTEASAGYDAEA